jgi:leucyl aminopeptidase
MQSSGTCHDDKRYNQQGRRQQTHKSAVKGKEPRELKAVRIQQDTGGGKSHSEQTSTTITAERSIKEGVSTPGNICRPVALASIVQERHAQS